MLEESREQISTKIPDRLSEIIENKYPDRCMKLSQLHPELVKQNIIGLAQLLNVASIHSHYHVPVLLHIASTPHYINALLRYAITEHNGNNILMNVAQTPPSRWKPDLRLAASTRIIESVLLTTNAQRFFNHRNHRHDTALMMAIKHSPKIAETLLIRPLLPGHTNWNRAQQKTYVENTLLATNREGQTPLMMALEQDNNLVELILLRARESNCLTPVLSATNKAGLNILMQCLLCENKQHLITVLEFALTLDPENRHYAFISCNVLNDVLRNIGDHSRKKEIEYYISTFLNCLEHIEVALSDEQAYFLIQIHNTITNLNNTIHKPETDANQLIDLLRRLADEHNEINLIQTLLSLCNNNSELESICSQEYNPNLSDTDTAIDYTLQFKQGRTYDNCIK